MTNPLPRDLKGGYCSSVDLEMGVRVRLREVSAYGRLKMSSFSREIAKTAVWCPLTRCVRLRQVKNVEF